MFVNAKALKIYNTNPQKASAQLEAIDSKLISTHGNAYQQSLYTQFDQEKFCLIPFGFDNDYATIYAIYGWMLEAEDLNLMRLSLVKKLHEEMFGAHGNSEFNQGKDSFQQKQSGRGVVIVYFSRANLNQKTGRNKKKIKSIQFTDFKNHVLKQIETKYLKFIKRIYVCHEGFLAKSINALPFSKIGIQNELIQSLLKFCDSLEDLVKCLGPLFECELVREEVQQQNSSLDWLSIFSDNHKKMAKRKMIDEVGEINVGSSFYKRKIIDYELDYQTGIPIILNALIKLLQSNQKFLESQGIFRKACRQQKLKKLQEQLVDCCLEEQVIKIGSRYDADTIACCIKAIFNRLNPPIIQYQYYDNLIAKMDSMYRSLKEEDTDKNRYASVDGQNNQVDQQNQNIKIEKNCFIGAEKSQINQDRVDELLAYLSYFIGANQRSILLRLIKFFRDSIIKNEKRNKMSAYNLSVVMGPCIFRPKKYSINDLMNSPRLAHLLFHMIKDPSKLE